MSLFAAIAANLQTLNQPLASNTYVHPDDVVGVKMRLRDDGYYETPPYGITPYADDALFHGIKSFQRDRGLTVDGIMNPDGETEHAMRFPIQLASNYPLPEVLAIKKEVFSDTEPKKGRESFSSALNKKDVSEREYRAFMNVHDMEGGNKADGNTVTGITPPTMRELNKRYKLGIPTTANPADLTPDEKVGVLRAYSNYSFERIGGAKALDKLPDNHAANALLDTMVRHGPEGGSLVVRRALNATTGKSLPPLDTGSGRMGPQTLGRLEEVYKSPTLKRGFYDHLADERLKDKNDGAGDRTRYDYYRLNK
jgi:peptidoglycan hydrolase-like protein with peptidoglycan-binding domain